jgi:hypothetical protein
MAIQEDFSGLTDAFEFDEDAAAGNYCGKAKVLAVPSDASGLVMDGDAKGELFVPGMRKGDGLPMGVVEGRLCGAGGRLLRRGATLN